MEGFIIIVIIGFVLGIIFAAWSNKGKDEPARPARQPEVKKEEPKQFPIKKEYKELLDYILDKETPTINYTTLIYKFQNNVKNPNIKKVTIRPSSYYSMNENLERLEIIISLKIREKVAFVDDENELEDIESFEQYRNQFGHQSKQRTLKQIHESKEYFECQKEIPILVNNIQIVTKVNDIIAKYKEDQKLKAEQTELSAINNFLGERNG